MYKSSVNHSNKLSIWKTGSLVLLKISSTGICLPFPPFFYSHSNQISLLSHFVVFSKRNCHNRHESADCSSHSNSSFALFCLETRVNLMVVLWQFAILNSPDSWRWWCNDVGNVLSACDSTKPSETLLWLQTFKVLGWYQTDPSTQTLKAIRFLLTNHWIKCIHLNIAILRKHQCHVQVLILMWF